MSRRSASPQGGSLVGEYPFLARFPFPKHLVLERGLLADDEEYPAGQQAGEEPEIVVAAVRHHDIAGLQAPAENLRLGGIVLPRASEDDEDGQQVPQAQRDMRLRSGLLSAVLRPVHAPEAQLEGGRAR